MRKISYACCLIFVSVAFISTAMWSQENESTLFSKPFITKVMKKVCDWQLQNPVTNNERNENDWARAAFYTGVMATYRTTHERKYLEAVLAWSESHDWKLANRLRHADDHARGQTYLEIYEVMKDPKMIADVKSTFDSLIADPRPGREDWWWCDALFMAPPVLARLAAATGDERYLEFLNTMFWDTYDFLYDREEHLFFRDKSFFTKRTPNGSKTFWARGNGWVMAGIVRVLQYLPNDQPFRDRYVSLLKEMAAAIKKFRKKTVYGDRACWITRKCRIRKPAAHHFSVMSWRGASMRTLD